MVINKPSGISMHPGAGDYDKTLVNALINYDNKTYQILAVKRDRELCIE